MFRRLKRTRFIKICFWTSEEPQENQVLPLSGTWFRTTLKRWKALVCFRVEGSNFIDQLSASRGAMGEGGIYREERGGEGAPAGNRLGDYIGRHLT